MDIEELKKMEGEESCIMKTMKGFCVGYGCCYLASRTPCREEYCTSWTLKMMGNHGATFSAIGGIYMGVEQLTQKQRVGGFVSGATVFGFKGRSVSSAMSAGGAFVATSVILEVLGIEKRDAGRINYVYTREKRPKMSTSY